jgi:hypothetical protein
MFSEVILVRDFINISVLDKPELIIISIPKNLDSQESFEFGHLMNLIYLYKLLPEFIESLLILVMVYDDYIIDEEYKNYVFRDKQAFVFFDLSEPEFFEFLG